MSFNEQEHQDQSADAGGAGGGGAGGDADDLSGVLGGQEASFVSGEKKPAFSTGTLIMAGFLLACGAGTYVMYTRSAPADTTPTAEAAAAETTITEFLTDDTDNVSKMKDLLQNTEKAVEQFRASPGKKQVPVEDLRTNPFRASLDAAEEEQVGAGTDDATAKRRAEAAKAALLKSAQSLQLQFVMSGKRKSCMINNAVYREGDTVGEFTVDSINTNEVVVRKDDARFKLQMKK